MMQNDESITDQVSHGTMSHSTTANDSDMATSTELPHTPAQASQPNASALSGNMNISNVPIGTCRNDKASGGSSFDWDSLIPKTKNSAFGREWQSLYGTAGKPGEKDVVSIAADFGVLLEGYHQRRREELVNERFDPALIDVMEKCDRAMKNVIWKKDVKALVTNNIMEVMDDSDAMKAIFEQNPQFLTKAFEMMANENALQKLKNTRGFKSEWLTNMQLAIDTTNKKLNVGNAAVDPEEGVSPLTSQKNKQIAHDTEDKPIVKTFIFKGRSGGGGFNKEKKKPNSKM